MVLRPVRSLGALATEAEDKRIIRNACRSKHVKTMA
jgi:hypothetical protein